MAGTNLYALSRIFGEVLKKYSRRPQEYSARMGNAAGDLYPDPSQPNIIWIRDITNGLERKCFNQTLPNVWDLSIKVGYTEDQPRLLQVLRIDNAYGTWPPYAKIPPGIGKMLKYPGPDTLMIRGEQFLPALVAGNNGFTLTVYPTNFKKSDGTYGNFKPNLDGTPQTVDCTSHIPATGAIAVLVSIKDDATIALTDGTAEATPELITAADVPAVDATYHPLCYVRLFSGQSVIRDEEFYTDIFDLRWMAGAGTGGSTIVGPFTPYLVMTTDSAGNIGTFNPYLWSMSGSVANEKSPSFGFDRAPIGGGGLAHALGDGSGVAGRFYAWYWGTTNQPGHTGIREDGTKASPTYVKKDMILEVLRGGGYGVIDGIGTLNVLLTGYEVRLIADEDWSTDSSHATRLELWGTKVGSTSVEWIATFHSNGTFDGESIPPSKQELPGNLTLLDKQYWIAPSRLHLGTYNLKLQGNSYIYVGRNAHFIPDDGWIPLQYSTAFSLSATDAPNYVVALDSRDGQRLRVGYKLSYYENGACKFFIVVAVGENIAGTTLVTLFGGTQYSVTSGATISGLRYSLVKYPKGFPPSPAVWSVSASSSVYVNKLTPGGTWWGGSDFTQNPSGSGIGLSIDVPIGAWLVDIGCTCEVFYTSASVTTAGFRFSFSDNKNADNFPDWDAQAVTTVPIATALIFRIPVKISKKLLTVVAKTTYYLIMATGQSPQVTALDMRGDLGTTSIVLTSAYL